MRDFSAESRREPEISATGSGSDAPLWLLQTDETRPLYLSLFLSVTVHIILFAVMAATRIFHPFAGASQEFDLVWFSPTPTAAPMVSPPAKPTSSKPEKLRTAQTTPTAKRSAPAITQVKKEAQPPAPAKTETAPANNPPQPPPAAAQVQTAKEMPIEEPSEMVLSRYNGKVVEVVDKKGDIPTFTVMSSVMKKSLEARAVVKTIRETDRKEPKRGEAKQKAKPSEGTLVAALPKEGSAENRGEAIAIKPVINQPDQQDRSGTSEKPVTPTASATTAADRSKRIFQLSDRQQINQFLCRSARRSFRCRKQAVGKCTGSTGAGKRVNSCRQGINSSAEWDSSGRQGFHTSKSFRCGDTFHTGHCRETSLSSEKAAAPATALPSIDPSPARDRRPETDHHRRRGCEG